VYGAVKLKVFYLPIYSIAFRTIALSPFSRNI